MIRPTDFELKLLRHLWSRDRLSARELHDASHEDTLWSYSTTRTALDRMVEKGLLRVERFHGLNTYVAAQSKLETLAALSKAFARDVLGLNAPLPIAAFASSPFVSPDEIAELEALLEENIGNLDAEGTHDD